MGYALEGTTNASGENTTYLQHKISAVETGNSSVVELDADGVFTGTGEDLNGYAAVLISVYTDVVSATDGLSVQFSHDNSDWHETDAYTISAGTLKTFHIQPVAEYIRVVYTNGGTGQGEFHLHTAFYSVAPRGSSHRMQDTISSEDDAELVKAVLTARRDNNSYQNVDMDFTGSLNVAFGDSSNLDAFSRLRTSTPDTVFDSTFGPDLQPLLYETSTAVSGTVTHSANDASAVLSTAASAGSTAIIQSKHYHRYIPGKGQLGIMTGRFGAATAGNIKRVGLFDANDGVFYEQGADGTMAVVIRSSTSGSPVEDRVTQANWNIDTLDGSGDANNRSGITLDVSKVYIFIIEMQWLGMGRVRVALDIGGRIIPIHEFNHANISTTVYMKTANLPNRWEISTAGGATTGTMLATCCTVQSEGGADKFLGYQFAYSRAAVTAGSGTQTYAFSIRPKATFNSLTNRSLIRISDFDCLNIGSNPVLVEVYYATAVGGSPSWTDMDATYSALQVDTAGTPSGGTKVAQFWVGAAAGGSAALADKLSFASRYPLTLDIAGTGFNHFTVYVTGQGGTSSCRPGLTWEETR